MKRRSFLKQTGTIAAASVIPVNEMLGASKQPKAKKGGPDYTSRVPKFTFATTLKDQEEQLKTNPLMLRFAESRRKMATAFLLAGV